MHVGEALTDPSENPVACCRALIV